MPNNFSANCTKKLGKLNMQAVPVVFSEPSEILLARGTRQNKKKSNAFMKKVIPTSVRLS